MGEPHSRAKFYRASGKYEGRLRLMRYRTFRLITACAIWGGVLPLLPLAGSETEVMRLPPVESSPRFLVKQVSFDSFEEPAGADLSRRMDRLEQAWEAFLKNPEAERIPAEPSPPTGVYHLERWGQCELYAGGEIVVMKPRFENGAEEDDLAEVLDFSMSVVPRVWLGYWNPGDNGLRARYWHYNDGSSTTPSEPETPDEPLRFMRLQAGAVDLEIAQRLNLAGWHLTVGVGGRYAWLEQRLESVQTGAFMFKRFQGIGPVVAVDMRRPFGRRGFAWVANLRGSLLVGESRWRDPAGAFDADDIGSIAEMQIGLEWRTPFGARSELVVGGFYEQQMWFGAGTHFHPEAPYQEFTADLRAQSHDVAFMGFVASVQLSR